MKFFCATLLLAVCLLSVPLSRAEDAPAKKLNLGDLGFTEDTLKPNKENSALLETRSKKLKTHQILGITTWALMGASLLSGPGEGHTSGFHKALGLATAVSYFSTAYFSLSAPDPVDDEGKGRNVKLHKTLAWIHFPLMILTPISGIIAENQIKKGQDPHGLGGQMGTLGAATFGVFTLAAATMIFEF